MNIQKINNVAFNGVSRIIVAGHKNGSDEDTIEKIPTYEITAIKPSEDYKTSTIYWKPRILSKVDHIVVDNTKYSSSCPANGHNAIINAYTAAAATNSTCSVDIYV